MAVAAQTVRPGLGLRLRRRWATPWDFEQRTDWSLHVSRTTTTSASAWSGACRTSTDGVLRGVINRRGDVDVMPSTRGDRRRLQLDDEDRRRNIRSTRTATAGCRSARAAIARSTRRRSEPRGRATGSRHVGSRRGVHRAGRGRPLRQPAPTRISLPSATREKPPTTFTHSTSITAQGPARRGPARSGASKIRSGSSAMAGAPMDLDWVRLTQRGSRAATPNLQWSGSAARVVCGQQRRDRRRRADLPAPGTTAIDFRRATASSTGTTASCRRARGPSRRAPAPRGR